ncbi:FAD-dependent monooxygenase [Alteraurantiacibacter buctensis]|uniref:3-hydroxybenzoate 4-monooxygenase n=1 Tax=Alteraurantiacibacter buctensis TaxID=1503981 RepID=A0A844YZN0_9SPHN|nr:FAD-dependent monooxygenase [Alteraurantiacibacter buctensis]MXO73019.1 3-hydroxybenzoate 4-monooxygenase [Alteraurantiacibacter buctensis]
MQFHFDGFQVGDPDLASPSAKGIAREMDDARLPAYTDVLIVGCGPAGLTLAAQLSAFPDIDTCIVDQRPGPLELGQADGIACRTMEMFNAFGFAEQVLREAYWVNETTFWRPSDDAGKGIVRGGWVKDTEPGLSEFPHVILNQARVHGFYLEIMRKSPNRLAPFYAWRLAGLSISRNAGDAYPVEATFEKVGANSIETCVVKARYAVGCDGARSEVRRSLGLALQGEAANQAWGVMDVLAVTDFPDLRKKCLIRSADGGSIVLIPREGGYLSRIYVELDKLESYERASQRNITLEKIIEAAQATFAPYAFDVKDVAWWSVYEIGQRLCPRFDDVPPEAAGTQPPRVFIAGDACHTHSPKAGQGMNVSMQDAFNLGWKLAAVLRGQSDEAILSTYSAERHAIAKELIDFDREWAAMLSAPLKATPEAAEGDVTPEEIKEYFVRQGRYTAGTATTYSPSLFTGDGAHQDLAKGFVVGTRLHSAPVVRLADARPMHIGHTVTADGRWRILAFADRSDPCDPASALWDLCDYLDKDPASPVNRFTSPDSDRDSVIDVRVVFQQDHPSVPLERTHSFLMPARGKFAVQDREKIFCPAGDGQEDIFDMRGIDRDRGCLVIVRPDQYVAEILPLGAHEELAAFFARFLVDRT